jgi:hypothetical protein
VVDDWIRTQILQFLLAVVLFRYVRGKASEGIFFFVLNVACGISLWD